MEQEQFVKYPLVLMKSTGYVSEKTGEFVKLSLAEKQIYIYMKNRFDFFVRENKGEYYDSQVDIADCCGVEVKTVQRTVKKFVEDGVFTIFKQKYGKDKNLDKIYYRNMKDLVLWKKVEDKQELLSGDKSSSTQDDSHKVQVTKKDSVKVVNICDYSDLPPWEQSGYSFYEDREPIF